MTPEPALSTCRKRIYSPIQYAPALEGMGVPQAIIGQRLTAMSGGQRTKVLLARFLLEPSDILLLDEPTNNLDMPSLLWLEAFLSSSGKAMIIISHDLYFLNRVADRVFALKNGSLTIERGSYGEYLERKKKEFARQMKEYPRVCCRSGTVGARRGIPTAQGRAD